MLTRLKRNRGASDDANDGEQDEEEKWTSRTYEKLTGAPTRCSALIQVDPRQSLQFRWKLSTIRRGQIKSNGTYHSSLSGEHMYTIGMTTCIANNSRYVMRGAIKTQPQHKNCTLMSL